MKKTLIVLSAIMAVIGAYAGNCSVTPAPVEDTAWVYEWKFSGKTTRGLELPGTPGNACTAGTAAECAIRTSASLKIQGYTYYCAPECGSSSFGDVAEANEVFWSTSPYKVSLAGGVTTEICHIIAKAKTANEIAGTATFTDPISGGTYNITYAGMGKYDKKNGRVTSCSGSFAGTLTRPVLFNKNLCTPIYAGFWLCDSLTLSCEEESTVVYGSWSCKYKSTASKKYAKHGTLASTPSWVEYLNAQP